MRFGPATHGRRGLLAWSRLLRRLALAALALLVTVAVLRAGTAYIYCAMMDEVRATECCAHVHGSSDVTLDAVPDCCRRERLGALPLASSPSPAGDSDGVGAPFLADVAPPWPPYRAPEVSTGFERGRRRAPTGPPRPSAWAPRLRVFLI